jgi:hypothetical protein
MCSIGNKSDDDKRILKELDDKRILKELDLPQGNSDLSTTASSNLVASEISTWNLWPSTDTVEQFMSVTPNPCSSWDKVDTVSELSYQRTGLQYLAQSVAESPRKMQDFAVLAPGARPVDPPTQRRLPRRLPPQALRVAVPSRQSACSGLYVLVPNEQPNGRPLWRQKEPRTVHWLFCSSSGQWCIGGADVQRESFSRGAGYVTQTWPSGPDVFPHDCETPWQLWDKKSKMFKEDLAIQITNEDRSSSEITSPINNDATSCAGNSRRPKQGVVGKWCARPPTSLEVTDCANQTQSMDRNIDCKDSKVPPVIEVVSRRIPRILVGDYVRVAGARPNGQPLWHKEDGNMWLYNAMDNRWYIAGLPAKLLQFSCATGEIYHAEEHLGRLPHQMSSSWEINKQGTWTKDPDIAFRANWVRL